VQGSMLNNPADAKLSVWHEGGHAGDILMAKVHSAETKYFSESLLDDDGTILFDPTDDKPVDTVNEYARTETRENWTETERFLRGCDESMRQHGKKLLELPDEQFEAVIRDHPQVKKSSKLQRRCMAIKKYLYPHDSSKVQPPRLMGKETTRPMTPEERLAEAAQQVKRMTGMSAAEGRGRTVKYPGIRIPDHRTTLERYGEMRYSDFSGPDDPRLWEIYQSLEQANLTIGDKTEKALKEEIARDLKAKGLPADQQSVNRVFNESFEIQLRVKAPDSILDRLRRSGTEKDYRSAGGRSLSELEDLSGVRVNVKGRDPNHDRSKMAEVALKKVLGPEVKTRDFIPMRDPKSSETTSDGQYRQVKAKDYKGRAHYIGEHDGVTHEVQLDQKHSLSSWKRCMSSIKKDKDSVSMRFLVRGIPTEAEFQKIAVK